MKKLITLIAGLLLVALPVGLAGCDDSDKEIYNDGRLVTDVVIPTSMTVYRGMEVSVSGYGFAQGDAIALRAGEDLPAATTVASEKLLTFVIPDGAADQTADATNTIDGNFDAHERTHIITAIQGSDD